MTDKTYCSIALTFQEHTAIGIAICDYGARRLGVKYPPGVLNSKATKDFNRLSKSRRLQILMDCLEEMKQGAHKAFLDARLEEMGHKRSG